MARFTQTAICIVIIDSFSVSWS